MAWEEVLERGVDSRYDTGADTNCRDLLMSKAARSCGS